MHSTSFLKCGMRRPFAPKLNVRILLDSAEDVTTEYGEFPWIILILKKVEKSEDLYERLCGGSLITPKSGYLSRIN